MLTPFACDNGSLRRIADPSGEALRGAVWIDLLSPTADEVRLVESATGLEVSTRDELGEIETSSRLVAEDGVFYLSMPLAFARDSAIVPVGFVLGRDRLLTIRFADSAVFEQFADRKPGLEPVCLTAAHVLVGLLEAIADRQADALEQTRDELEAISRRIFHPGTAAKSNEEDRQLRQTLAAIGRSGELVSDLHDSHHGAGRIVGFLLAAGRERLPDDLLIRLKTLRQDLSSLNDFSGHLNNKVQFLLDATLGFINIMQSHVIKVLAVVGTVGVPPTLIASIYGMNFEAMPELHFSWGYPMALGLIVLSAVVPLLWFRHRGWL
jgi:magnesium transporter